MNDNVFAGILGKNYETIKLICPLATEMSYSVGEGIKHYLSTHQHIKEVLEIGGGTGITTLSILLANPQLTVTSIDNAIVMQQQARKSLKSWVDKGMLHFIENDALQALKSMPSDDVDIVASAYTLHNFEHPYREKLVREIFRILKPGGLFINGDRCGLDDIAQHTALIEQEIKGYFKVLITENKLDELIHWVTHLFVDEGENRLMREKGAREQLVNAGFAEVKLSQRMEVNALIRAIKT